MRVFPEPQEYAQRHSKAFRGAFDFLNAHFPPEPTATWWDQTAADAAKAGEKFCDNPLFTELIAAVLDYIGKESKMREEG